MLPAKVLPTKPQRAKVLRREAPPIETYLAWAAGLTEPPRAMPVLGASRPARALVYRALATYLTTQHGLFVEPAAGPSFEGLTVAFDSAFGRYGLAWELAVTRSLAIEYPLRDLVDYEDVPGDLFRLLWEMRFALREAPDGVNALSWLALLRRWCNGQPTPEDSLRLDLAHVKTIPATLNERLEVLLLLLTLAFQNGVFDRAVIAFDAVDAPGYPLGDLLEIIRSLDSWTVNYTLPIGVLVGFQPENLAALRKAYLPV